MPRHLVTFTPESGLEPEEVVCDSLTADPADRDLYRAVGGEHNGASFSVQAVAQIEELREEVPE